MSGWPGEPGLRRASRSLEEDESRRRERRRGRLNTDLEERIVSRSKASKARCSCCGSRLAGERSSSNVMEARTGDESVTAAEREKPLDGENPGRGSRTKQAYRVEGGANRREVEKT